jgi:hypothetical protein
MKPIFRQCSTNDNERIKAMRTLRIGCIAAALVMPVFRSGGTSLPSQVDGHRSGITAKIVSVDRTTRTVKLQGIGCTESMCSRVFIRSKDENGAPVQIWLDSIASIQDATASNALFVMKNGSERRMGFVSDFRVLYVSSPSSSRTEKLDLAKVRSLEFLDARR